MQHERRVVDAEKGIVQITTEDERWYAKKVEDADGKVIYIPSVTWICEYYPKGVAFFKWLASKGWDEAEALKESAGIRGTYTHKASDLLLQGKVIRYDSIVDDRELTTEEYAGVMSFVDWHREYKPKVIATELTVFSPDDRYAGTLDLLCEIQGERWIVDFKTSADIWPSHELQVSAYAHTFEEPPKAAILQLGYKRNKTKKWKFTPIADQFDLFNAAYLIWQRECAGIKPLQKDYPLELKLNIEEEK